MAHALFNESAGDSGCLDVERLTSVLEIQMGLISYPGWIKQTRLVTVTCTRRGD